MLQAEAYSEPWLSTRPVGIVTWACVILPWLIFVIRPTLLGSNPGGGGPSPAGAPYSTSDT